MIYNDVKRWIYSLFGFCYTAVMKIMIGFRVTKEFKKLLKQLATSENRTLSNFLYNAVVYYIEHKRGVDLKRLKSEGTNYLDFAGSELAEFLRLAEESGKKQTKPTRNDEDSEKLALPEGKKS
jgi:hypothetical protein